ncbi:ECF transporter S component [Tepidibacter aestuarii]|uniref:ECF transporter S component n=1 Tax=Tepidibacter aestuarii TaxID=2925782 RepID=UPI0020BFF216|nr:ECF transporter S component [Tepidibacter aestuarii]CAH2212004.1 Alpha-ribazole transporter [Tepidibacter aestuarii]
MKKLVKISMLIALSFIGSLIKIPGTSIAFDSMPAYFAALSISPLAGGIVGVLGHAITAYLSGFPLTIVIHSIIGVQMFLFVFIFGYVYKFTQIIVPIIFGVLLNGVVAPLILIPVIGFKMSVGFIIPLSIVSFANIYLAYILYKSLNKRYRKGVFTR